jgi:hypothetical protein
VGDYIVMLRRHHRGGLTSAFGESIAPEDSIFAKRYVAAFQMLRLHGDCGRDALAVLLSDPRADVRVMAAAFAAALRGKSAGRFGNRGYGRGSGSIRSSPNSAALERGNVDFGPSMRP